MKTPIIALKSGVTAEIVMDGIRLVGLDYEGCPLWLRLTLKEVRGLLFFWFHNAPTGREDFKAISLGEIPPGGYGEDG